MVNETIQCHILLARSILLMWLGLIVYMSHLHHVYTHTHTQIKKHQQKIEMILSSKGYDVEYIDVAASEEDKKKMRDLSGNPKALPPQIFNDDQYCGVSRSTVLTIRS